MVLWLERSLVKQEDLGSIPGQDQIVFLLGHGRLEINAILILMDTPDFAPLSLIQMLHFIYLVPFALITYFYEIKVFSWVTKLHALSSTFLPP